MPTDTAQFVPDENLLSTDSALLGRYICRRGPIRARVSFPLSPLRR